MNRKFVIFIFIIGFVNRLPAQTDTLKNDVFGGFIIFPVEFPIIDNQPVNNELANLGYPELDYPAANTGIGLQLYSNRWITTFSFNKTTKKNVYDNYLTEVEYRSTSLNTGYDLIKNYKYSIYPFVGFKGYGLNYLYRDKFSGETSFNDYFNTTLEYKEITHSRANLDFGIGFSFHSFFLVNFKLGYLLPLEEVRWNINNNQDKLSRSPSLSYNYYFTLTIGLGNIADENEMRRRYNESE